MFQSNRIQSTHAMLFPCIHQTITRYSGKPVISSQFRKEMVLNIVAIPSMYNPIVSPFLQIPHSLINDKMETQGTSLHRDGLLLSPSMRYYRQFHLGLLAVTFRLRRVELLRVRLDLARTYTPSTRDM